MSSMGSHQSAAMLTDNWLTPKYILDALGKFDLDPCCADDMPWSTADKMLTKKDDGLATEWVGRVWLNPPYSREATKWLKKIANHGDGIALIFARTETRWFFEHIWEKANAILFLRGRLHFCYPDGAPAVANAGAPSCLVAYGHNNALKLKYCDIDGQYIFLRF